MPVSSSDIKLYKASVNNDTAANGGKISANLITSGAVGNVFPNVSDAELTAGGTRYRKVFVKNENAADIAWESVAALIKEVTAGADWVRAKPGTDTDTQSAAEAYTDWAGTGTLNSAASIGDSSIDVLYDDSDGVYDGAEIEIYEAGTWERATVSGTPSWVGNVATVALASTLANDYTTAAKVMTRPALDDLTPTLSAWTETLTAGAFDESQVVLYNKGTVSGSFTLTFTDESGSFSVAEATLGAIGTGSTGVDFQPSNGTSYYLKLPAAAWSGGTPSSGDTITWTTTHAARSVWLKQEWPAGAASLTGNTATFAVTGESASL